MNIASIYPFPSNVGWYHDVNSTIITDDEIFSYEEAKLSENNSDYISRFPEKSLFMGFKMLNINPKKIDKWVFGRPFGCDQKIVLEFYLNHLMKLGYSNGDFLNNVEFVDHHLGHIGLGVYTSNFEDCCFLSCDGGGDSGDNHCLVWGVYEKKSGINILGKQKGERFAGFAAMHDLITELVGFGFFDNGKTSGLACYGKHNAEIANIFKNLITVNKNNLFDNYEFFCRYDFKKSDYRFSKLNVENYKRWHVLNTPGQFINIKEKLKKFNVLDIAKTGQDVLYEYISTFIKNLVLVTGKNKIICCGGLFQNITFNMQLSREFGPDKIYVPLASNDSGLSLGAALHIYNKYQNKNHKLIAESDYLTPSLGVFYPSYEVERVLNEYDVEYFEETDDGLAHFLFEKIISGNVVGWFRGRAELGPRSLGNRSVFADPRNPSSKARVNQLMKKRDWFMPYAPICIAEHAADWFEDISNDSPYMAMGYVVKIDKRDKIPSAVHVDGSSRPNTIRRNFNPVVYDSIKMFYNRTGVPMYLNTSFNRHGIPTVGKIRQAIDHLNSGAVDFLVINNYCVSKKERNKTSINKLVDESHYVKMLNVMPFIQSWLDNGRICSFEIPNVSIVCNEKTMTIDGFKIYAGDSRSEDVIQNEIVKWFSCGPQ